MQAVAICFLNAYREPAHEREAAAIVAAEAARCPRVALLRRGGGDRRIRALRHHLRQRLCAAADGDLSAPAGAGAAQRGFRRIAAPDALGGRAGLGAGRARLSHPAAGIRPGRRRARRVAAGRAGRPRRPAGVRHGRHHRQGLPDRGRPRADRPDDGSRARASLQERLRPADQGPHRRHDRDRRRRRLDRRDRRRRAAARRPAIRRRRARPGLLRARRAGADRHRRQPRPRLLRPRLLPRRHHGARPASRAQRHRHASPPRSASRSSRPPGASTRWSSRAWPTPPASTWSSAARTRAVTPWLASAAPVPLMPARSPVPWASANWSCPPHPARHRRWASWSPRYRPAASGPCSSGSIPNSTWAASKRCCRRSQADAQAELAQGGVTTGLTVERTADMRLVGQMHEIAVRLPDAAARPSRPDSAAFGVRGRLHRPLRRRAARRPGRGREPARHRHRADPRAVAARTGDRAPGRTQGQPPGLVRRRLQDRDRLRPLHPARRLHDRRPRHRGGARGHHHRGPRRRAARGSRPATSASPSARPAR